MHRISHDELLTRPGFEADEAVRTKPESDCGFHFRGKQTGYAMPGLVLLAMLFLQLQAPAATTSVELEWTPSADPTIQGYNIYYGGASQSYTNEISADTPTNAVIAGLVEGKTYYFAATAYSAFGLESSFSSELVYRVPIPNQPPTLNVISNLTVIENTGLQTINLSNITSGSAEENQPLSVTATSSDTNLFRNPTVNYTSPNTNGSIRFVPEANANGTAILTVTVNDGQTRNNFVTRMFTVTVLPDSTHYLIINPLTNLVTAAGQTITFRTTTNNNIGNGKLSYQWKFNGTSLASATNLALTLSNVTTNQTGIYSVTATLTPLLAPHSSTSQAGLLTVYPTAAARLTPAALVSSQYTLAVAGVPGYKYVVQASTNLINWISLQTNTAPFTFVDVNAGNFRQRFYRSVYAP